MQVSGVIVKYLHLIKRVTNKIITIEGKLKTQ